MDITKEVEVIDIPNEMDDLLDQYFHKQITVNDFDTGMKRLINMIRKEKATKVGHNICNHERWFDCKCGKPICKYCQQHYSISGVN